MRSKHEDIQLEHAASESGTRALCLDGRHLAANSMSEVLPLSALLRHQRSWPAISSPESCWSINVAACSIQCLQRPTSALCTLGACSTSSPVFHAVPTSKMKLTSTALLYKPWVVKQAHGRNGASGHAAVMTQRVSMLQVHPEPSVPWWLDAPSQDAHVPGTLANFRPHSAGEVEHRRRRHHKMDRTPR